MIQRIQSLYLLMTTFLSLLFLKGAYLTFFDNSNVSINLAMTGLFKINDTSGYEKIGEAWFILTLGILIPLLSMISIFLFKKRDLQIKLVKFLLVLIVGFIAASVVYSVMIISRYDASFDNWYKLSIPVVQLILTTLALNGIKKDDDLVKSYDRLR
jgi:hypothetical protein